MINHRFTLALLCLSLILGGCRQDQRKAGVEFPEGQTKEASPQQNPVDAGKEQPLAVTPGPSNPEILPNGKTTPESKNPSQPKQPEVKWREAKSDISTIATKMDTAIRGLANTTCDYSLYLKTPREEGTSDGTSLFLDAKNFLIEAIDLDDMFGKVRVISNGDKAKELGRTGWVNRPSAGKPSFRSKDPATKGILARTSLLAFSSLTDGVNFWSNLVKGMKSEGYKVELISADMDVYGSVRPFYKIVSKRKGKGINDLSITIDGSRFVPLTVKVLETRADGKYETEWRTRFRFGQKIDREKLKLPN